MSTFKMPKILRVTFTFKVEGERLLPFTQLVILM